MTLTQLYIFTVLLPNLHDMSEGPIWMLPLFALGGFGFLLAFGIGEEIERAAKAGMRGVIACLVMIFVLTLCFVVTPDEKQLYTIAGGYVATNTKDVAKLPDNVVKAANAWLEKAATLADDKPKSKK